MPKKFTGIHVVYTVIFIIVLVIVMYTAIVLRDYNIVTDGGIHLKSKTPVAGPPGYSLDNSVPEKLIININDNGSEGYDLQIGRFENMMFSKTYRTALPRKDLGLMKGGKKYYVRARSVITKSGTSRKIHGEWGKTRSVVIKAKK